MRKNKDNFRIYIIVFLVLFFSALHTLTLLFIPPNMQVNNIKLGMVKKSELDSVLEKTLSNFEQNKVHITYKDQSKTYTLSDLGISVDRLKTKQEILAASKPNIINFFTTLKDGKEFKPSCVTNTEKFYDSLEIFEDNTAKKPINAYYKYQHGKVVIVNEVPGYILAKDNLLQELLDDPFKENLELSLSLEYVQPEITKEILNTQGVNEIVSSYRTSFNPSNKSRSTNLQLAVNAINGTVIAPNEIFSFNNVVGQRTAQRGYQNSIVFENGIMVSGLGGGICQVSTTLYNAVLLGDYKIIERSNHSITIPYADPSRDATVAWGYQDFKFQNQTDRHLFIHSEVQGNQVVFNIFSTKVPNKKVTLESVVISRESNKCRSKLIKKVYYNNNLSHTYTVSTDTYKLSSSPSLKPDKPKKTIKETMSTENIRSNIVSAPKSTNKTEVQSNESKNTQKPAEPPTPMEQKEPPKPVEPKEQKENNTLPKTNDTLNQNEPTQSED